MPLIADVEQSHSSRWEWRAFASEFAPLKISLPSEFEATDQSYVLCPESSVRARIRGGMLSVDVLEQQRDGLELWRRSQLAAFPLCQRDVREALRQFPVALPTLYRPEYSPFEFVTDVATCTNGLRVVGLRTVRRRVLIGDCTIERATVSLAGRTLQTVAVTGIDPIAVRRHIQALQLDQFANQNIVLAIKSVLGMSVNVVPERIPEALGDFSHAHS